MSILNRELEVAGECITALIVLTLYYNNALLITSFLFWQRLNKSQTKAFVMYPIFHFLNSYWRSSPWSSTTIAHTVNYSCRIEGVLPYIRKQEFGALEVPGKAMKRNDLLLMLLLFGTAISLFGVGFYLYYMVINGIALTVRNINFISLIFFANVIAVLFISRKIYLHQKCEKERELNAIYYEHLQKLFRVIQMQRHDFVNHMQVIFALLKTKQIERAEEYITGISQRVNISKAILQIQIPELVALLLVKMDTAAAKGISLKIDVEPGLTSLGVEPIDLNTIIGNLLDNALEAVENGKQEDKAVELRIFTTPGHYYIQTINPGYLQEEMREKIFRPGFSTKQGKNRGVGLVSVKSVVEKNRGNISVSCSEGENIKFTVVFPK